MTQLDLFCSRRWDFFPYQVEVSDNWWPFKMATNINASSQRVLKLARLTNMKTGQMLLGKGTKGSLTVLGASSTSSNSSNSSGDI